MVRAIGYSVTSFRPLYPGRLCRGRERWIMGWEGEPDHEFRRLVISGAEFSDDSARDARRGLTCAGIHPGELILSLFPGFKLVAFREDAVLGELPEGVTVDDDDPDAWLAPRRGGAWFDSCKRWRMEVSDPEQISQLVAEEIVDGFVVTREGMPLSKELEDAIFLFTGQGDGSQWPVRRFQPLALDELLQHCEAVICLHLDKHGPALAVYSRQPVDRSAEIRQIAAQYGALAVPFAIPPMLARWDRALQELRLHWMSEHDEDFPVPPAEEPTRWSRGRGRSWRSTGEE